MKDVSKFQGVNPTGSSAARATYGLYDMAGNLWQLRWDWFSADHYTP
jgi:formylglycine-generating enzyme required for sulfatase activity